VGGEEGQQQQQEKAQACWSSFYAGLGSETCGAIINSTEQHCSPLNSSICTHGSSCPVSTTAYAALFMPAQKIVWHCGCSIQQALQFFADFPA